jgi:hypothetical protein
MRSTSSALRRLPSALLGVGSTVAVGFATEALMRGGAHWWWWLALAAGVSGFVGSSVWFRAEGRSASAATVSSGGESAPGVAQQSTHGSDSSVVISSDNGSVAAWNIAGNVMMGNGRNLPDPLG